MTSEIREGEHRFGGMPRPLPDTPTRAAGGARGDLGLGAPDRKLPLGPKVVPIAHPGRATAVVHTAFEAVVICDAEAMVLFASPSLTRIAGYLPSELVGHMIGERLVAEDRPLANAAFLDLLSRPAGTRHIELRALRQNGSPFWIEAMMTNRLDDPEVRGVVMNIRDLSEARAAEDALRASDDRYRAIVEMAQEGICTVDADGRVIFANRRMAELVGREPAVLAGMQLNVLLGRAVEEALGQSAGPRSAAEPVQIEISAIRPDGSEMDAIVSLTPLSEPADALQYLVMVVDVTRLRRTEEELARTALFDALTGLPNRS